MNASKTYVGIHADLFGGMTDTGKVIRDAWALGLLPETETCEGWTAQGIEKLWHDVSAAWEPYGFLVSNLPEDKKQAYLRIQEAAIARARAAGWNPDRDLED